MQVEFVSPEAILYSGEAEIVVARTRGGGEIAFLEGHEPFIGSLITSKVRVVESGDSEKVFAVRGGFVSVDGKKVTVLSDAAVAAGDIDVAAAQKDLEKADAALEENPESKYSQADRKWAQIRLSATGAIDE